MAKNENKNAEPQTVDLNQQRKVRREKLANLQAEGRDPFQNTKYYLEGISAFCLQKAEIPSRSRSMIRRIIPMSVRPCTRLMRMSFLPEEPFLPPRDWMRPRQEWL